MYQSFYNLKEKPFSATPDPRFLFESRQHGRALTLAQYGLLNQAGFVVVTGEAGCGKTTLVRRLVGAMREDFGVGVVSNTQCESYEELLRWILLAFDLEFRGKEKVELFRTLSDFLDDEHAEGRNTVLIVDEAQQLTHGGLEQLRMVSNVNVDGHQLLQVLLVGQPGLWRQLREPQMAQLAQRIGVDFHLEPLEAGEVQAYVRHRLTVAGGDPDVFEPETFPVIGQATGGVPRLINMLCDAALVYGYSDGARRVNEGLLREVLRDRAGGLTPFYEVSGKGADPRRAGAAEV